MVRKLSLAVAMVLGVVPFGVQALGLGDIRTKSALNQRFNADILLYSVGEAEIADVRVRLAPPELFLEAGIERPHFLTKLKFEPVLLPDGSSVIKVTSPDPVREPFLDFLIEVDWPKGQMLREYTVLLDPPVTTEQRPAPVQRPAAGMPAIQRESTARPASAAAAMSMTGGAGGTYGPTRRNETLWGIAKKVRHSGTSMEQMVMSLLYANPQAFIGNNVNNLRVGQILRVPSREEVMGLKYSDAHSAFRAQMNDWRASRSGGTAGGAGAQAAPPQMPESAPVAGAEPVQPQAELKIAPAKNGAGEEAPAADSGVDDKLSAELQHELIMANEATQSALEEGQELRSRVEDLESQLQDLQRLLELKSEQLAEMQGMLGGETAALQPDAPGPEMEQTGPDAVPESPVEPDMASAEEGAPVPEAALQEEIEAVQEPVVEEPEIVLEEELVSQETVPVTTPEKVSPVTEPVSPPKPAAEVKPKAKPKPKPAEKSIIEKLSGDTTLMGIGAGAIVVILGLLWLVISRRRRGTDEFQESILINTIDEKDDVQPRMEGTREIDAQPQEETSFLSDFSPSDIDPLQGESGEVDSLAEADVYVAYGRYRQAEELIREAMEREPERLELKAKLFEILYAIKDKDGFIELAQRSVEEGLPDSDSEVWSRVVSMGSKMAPSNALFAAGGEASIQQEPEEAPRDSLGDLDDLDLKTPDSAADAPKGETVLDLGGETVEEAVMQGADETEQVFSLDLETEAPEETEETAKIAQEADLDFSGLDLEQTSEAIEALQETAIPEADLSVDTGLGQDELKPEQEVITLDEDLPDLSLEDLEMDLTATDQKDEGEVTETLSAEFSGAGTEKEPEAEAMAGIAALELPEDDGEFDLDTIDQSLQDEVDTKLDLARAYVDMEDREGARSILDEVLKEGNDEQKAAAEKMMVGLN